MEPAKGVRQEVVLLRAAHLSLPVRHLTADIAIHLWHAIADLLCKLPHNLLLEGPPLNAQGCHCSACLNLFKALHTQFKSYQAQDYVLPCSAPAAYPWHPRGLLTGHLGLPGASVGACLMETS